jgi:hypothetical protein
MTAVYNLHDFANIRLNGFDINLPEETMIIISELAQQVGSPTYIRTPNFQKKEKPMHANLDLNARKKRGNKCLEIVNDEDWELLRTFQTTNITQGVGVDADIETIRVCLNKITHSNYQESYDSLLSLLDKMTNECDMARIGSIIFEIASNNRFYSKLYADLYTSLIEKFDIMKKIFNTNLDSFMSLFNEIEYVDADQDYDKFCKINKDNERRKALSLFFVNLCRNCIIEETMLIKMANSLLSKLMTFINETNKKNEVDEITENIAILYDKVIFSKYNEDFNKTIEMLANCKPKKYASLTNKSIFKFMDLIEA